MHQAMKRKGWHPRQENNPPVDAQGRAVRRATAVFTTVTDVADHGRLIW